MQGTYGRGYPPQADRWKPPARLTCWGVAESEDQKVNINEIKWFTTIIVLRYLGLSI
jgi:hypothetical protein